MTAASQTTARNAIKQMITSRDVSSMPRFKGLASIFDVVSP
jgi:hypothetical protein